ncbi:HIT domain-containing protein [Candidatus Pacearchaeota archaeon]|nr:HIT domain-containing protein [Candidatus Pacearchaeota archaeon]MBD3282857.1 HIT domain-containing protein [Candidatus Pacearchaeota archaeon]
MDEAEKRIKEIEERIKKDEEGLNSLREEAGVSEDSECIFCKIVRGEVPADKIYESKNFLAFLDNNPKASGHTLIVPKQHYKDILDIPNSLASEMLDDIKKIGLNLINEGKGDGFNVAVNVGESSGQVVEHAHIHVIPRKQGDGLKAIA